MCSTRNSGHKSEILVADSDCGSGAEASDVEVKEEEHHQKQASAEDKPQASTSV